MNTDNKSDPTLDEILQPLIKCPTMGSTGGCPMCKEALKTAHSQIEALFMDGIEEELKAAEENLKYHEEKTKNNNLIHEWMGTVFGIKLIRDNFNKRLGKMSDVASLELSKELYELSGWERDDNSTWYGEPASAICPKYTLGYLLRKLPNDTEIMKLSDDNYTAIIQSKTQPWHKKRTWDKTPENALCQLAIELIKSGES